MLQRKEYNEIYYFLFSYVLFSNIFYILFSYKSMLNSDQLDTQKNIFPFPTHLGYRFLNGLNCPNIWFKLISSVMSNWLIYIVLQKYVKLLPTEKVVYFEPLVEQWVLFYSIAFTVVVVFAIGLFFYHGKDKKQTSKQEVDYIKTYNNTFIILCMVNIVFSCVIFSMFKEIQRKHDMEQYQYNKLLFFF